MRPVVVFVRLRASLVDRLDAPHVRLAPRRGHPGRGRDARRCDAGGGLGSACRSLFRSGDRFHHLRFSARSQRYAAAIAVLAGVWGLYASVSFVVHEVTLAARDRQIADQRLAYFDLLSEVGEYHTQFSRITKDLEENQAYLLSLLEQGPRERTDLAAIQGRLKSSETEHARVVLAREGLRAKMAQFKTDLLEMAGKNITLQIQIAQVQNLLESSRAERDQVAAAREQLVTRLSEIEREPAETDATKQELETTVASLQRGLKASQGARQELETENSGLNASGG